MGALPKARAGIGSAMNSVARMVAGSIGVAALGSVLNNIYTSSFDKATSTLSLASEVAAVARDSVGAAVTVASKLPAEIGNALAQVAKQSFMDGFQVMAIISCVICALGSLVVLKIMPHKATKETTFNPINEPD
jgi:DHA2 family multidrug resistance protein-like MFS transporter